MSNYLCRQLRHNSITVIDLSSSMLDIARLRMPDAIIINESIERFYENNETKYDTILARQIFHYVDDVDNIVGILHKMLNKNGILYVGQFVVSDNDSNLWHESFIKKISVNRKRSFIDKEFISLFTNEGFEVVKTEYTPYEENIKSFYNRSTNLGINYGELYDYSVSSLKESVKNDLLIRITDDNLFFTVKFLHLFLTIK